MGYMPGPMGQSGQDYTPPKDWAVKDQSLKDIFQSGFRESDREYLGKKIAELTRKSLSEESEYYQYAQKIMSKALNEFDQFGKVDRQTLNELFIKESLPLDVKEGILLEHSQHMKDPVVTPSFMQKAHQTMDNLGLYDLYDNIFGAEEPRPPSPPTDGKYGD